MSGRTSSTGSVGTSGAGGTTMHDATPTTPVSTRHATGADDPWNQLEMLLNTPTGVELSPEMLISMAQRRLRDIEGQIGAAINEMNVRGDRLSNLRAATEAINNWRSEHHSDSGARFNIDEITVDVQHSNGTIDRGVPLRQALEAGGMSASQIPTGRLEDAALGNLCDAIRAQVDTVNQGSDIAQLQLQQLVSSRGQVAQTVSQLLAALHDNVKNILQNTRG